MYLLFSHRNGGWLTNSSTYSSTVNDAKVFDREEALEMCRRHRDRGGYNLFPVRQEDIEAI